MTGSDQTSVHAKAAWIVVIAMRAGSTIRHPVSYDGDAQSLERTWRRLLSEAHRVVLWDVTGAYVPVTCAEVATVAVQAAANGAELVKPTGAQATWFYQSSLKAGPKDLTAASPVLPG
jgi:hypothetical protein